MPEVQNLLITHPHPDHFDLEAVRGLVAARGSGMTKLHIWGSEEIVGRVRVARPTIDAHLHILAPELPVQVGGVMVTPLLANHGPLQMPGFNFVLTMADTHLFYAIDTAWPLERTLDRLAGLSLDGLIVDATYGPMHDSQLGARLEFHMSWSKVVRLRNLLVSLGALRRSGLCLASHMSIHHNPIHAVATEQLAKFAVVPAWDGMRVACDEKGP